MAVALHWFLPTSGDSRTDLSLGNAVGASGGRTPERGEDRTDQRAPDVAAAHSDVYLTRGEPPAQVARAQSAQRSSI